MLFAPFSRDDLGVSPAVFAELMSGLREGRQFLQGAVELVEHGRLKLFALTAPEVLSCVQLPS